MAKALDLNGQLFGLWTVLGRGSNTKQGKATWSCKCECGVVRDVVSSSLVKGVSLSCGCRQPEIAAQANTTHGMTGTTEYRSWQMMMTRCHNKNNQDYWRYGGKGVRVCERWHKFENFYADMGDKPEGKNSIDRINGSGNYEPSNCRWANQYEQMNNVNKNIFIKVNGEIMTVAEAARKTEMTYSAVHWQYQKGNSLEVAL